VTLYDPHAPASAYANLEDQDVLVLKAIADELPAAGARIGRGGPFRACEVLLAPGSPGWPDDGPFERVCVVEREIYGDDAICFYPDATKTAALLRVTPRKHFGSSPGRSRRTPGTALRALTHNPTFDVSDADGEPIGTIEKELGERQYRISDTSDAEPTIAILEHEPIAIQEIRARLLLSRPFANDRFALWRGQRRMGWIEPDRSTRSDCTIDMTCDSEHSVDRRLVLAVGCLDLLRPRLEG
jgi:hypothetical protein